MQRRLAELESMVATTNTTTTTTQSSHGGSPPRKHSMAASSVIVAPVQDESLSPDSTADASQNPQHPIASIPQPPQPASAPIMAARHPVIGQGAGLSPLLSVLRELSIGALGEYIGATSQLTMSRIISSMMMRNPHDPKCGSGGGAGEEDEAARPSENSSWENLSPKSANNLSKADMVSVELGHVPEDIADKLLEGYIAHISTRWPVMHTPYIRYLHENRSSLTDTYEVTALHLVYAISGRFLETTGETGDFNSEQHCEKAIASLDEIIQRHAGLRSIQILTLLSIYNLRSPRGPGAWTFCGLAMRQCIELGLHRQTRLKWPLIEEMRRRVFWTVYCLDRQVSIILGRPFAISDRDIDVELPTDVEESIEDEALLKRFQEEARRNPSQSPPAKSTSMTGFIYICKLRIIESDIQQTIYRVDKAPPDMKSDVEEFIARLEHWRSQMPLDARRLPDFNTTRVDGYENYMVYYYKCMRFLLYPVILSSEVSNTHFLKKCAEACAGVCRTYKRLHQAVPVGFSVMALHSIFIAGLTLLYCVWAAPREVFSIASSNAMNACSIVMYVIAERWVGARKYRDVFDVIKQAVMESVEAGEDEPRRMISNLRDDVLKTLRVAGGDKAYCGEFSAMLNDMAGEQEEGHGEEGDAKMEEEEGEDLAASKSSSLGSGGGSGDGRMIGVPGGVQPGFYQEMQVTPASPFSFMFPPEGIPFDSMMMGFPSLDDLEAMPAPSNMMMSGPQDGWGVGNFGQYSR